MSYEYAKERAAIFTEAGQPTFLRVRENIDELLANSGAFKMYKAWAGVGGDTWFLMACVDRQVELGEIKEITENVAGQDRVFVRSR